jgi:endonuclease/exonuclease/phosphatase family metal-dependent hydrolase
VLRIDHVFLGGEVEALEVQILRGPLERVASDHLPLAVDIAVARGTSGK